VSDFSNVVVVSTLATAETAPAYNAMVLLIGESG
jgi:hypothetical protein